MEYPVICGGRINHQRDKAAAPQEGRKLPEDNKLE